MKPLAPFALHAGVFGVASLWLASPVHAAQRAPAPEQAAPSPQLFDSPEIRDLANGAAAKYNKHDYPGAIIDLNHLIDIAPQIPRSYTIRGFARLHTHDLAGAEADFQRVIEIVPKIPEGYLGLGELKVRRGDNAGAAAEFRRALQVDARCAEAYIDLGNIERRQKDYAKAEADYGRALVLKPSSALVWANCGSLRANQGRFAEATAAVDQALKLDPKLPFGYDTRAQIKRFQGDFTGALADYRRCVELDPASSGACHAVAYLEELQGQYEPALADARRALPSASGNVVDYIQFQVWSLRTRLGQSADADQQLSAYLAVRPQAASGAWRDHLGAFLLGCESEEALFGHAKTGEAWQVDDQHCEALYYAGLKKWFAGDKAAAAEFFRQCVATGQKTNFEYDLAQAALRTL